MDNNPIMNFITNAFKNLLPPIASIFCKDMVRRLLPGIVKSGLDMRFSIPDEAGNEVSFHNQFLEKPAITRQGVRLKVSATSDKSKTFETLIDETVSKPHSNPLPDPWNPWNPFDLPEYMDKMWEHGSKQGLPQDKSNFKTSQTVDAKYVDVDAEQTRSLDKENMESDESPNNGSTGYDSGYESSWAKSDGHDSGYESSSKLNSNVLESKKIENSTTDLPSDLEKTSNSNSEQKGSKKMLKSHGGKKLLK